MWTGKKIDKQRQTKQKQFYLFDSYCHILILVSFYAHYYKLFENCLATSPFYSPSLCLSVSLPWWSVARAFSPSPSNTESFRP